jgi:hypothetical protein
MHQYTSTMVQYTPRTCASERVADLHVMTTERRHTYLRVLLFHALPNTVVCRLKCVHSHCANSPGRHQGDGHMAMCADRAT